MVGSVYKMCYYSYICDLVRSCKCLGNDCSMCHTDLEQLSVFFLRSKETVIKTAYKLNTQNCFRSLFSWIDRKIPKKL